MQTSGFSCRHPLCLFPVLLIKAAAHCQEASGGQHDRTLLECQTPVCRFPGDDLPSLREKFEANYQRVR
uniref:Putative secreted protein n=1 Tax=Amblyomma triste TaxID=251400 RepID=A0A023G354_AMBTT